jgi:hypothetical protein
MRKILRLLFLVSIVSTLAGITAMGQDTELRNKRVTIRMKERPLYTVFYRLIEKYDVAIGFEESALDRYHRHYYFETSVNEDHSVVDAPEKEKEMPPPVIKFRTHLISVDFTDAKLEDVMNSIVKQLQYYDWEISDDVVNIFPKSGRDARLKKLLDTKVHRFALGRGSEEGEIQAALMLFLPEFKKFLADNQLVADTGRYGTTNLDKPLANDIVFGDLTFRQLLNAITKQKRGGWMLQIKERSDMPGSEFVELLI